VDFRLSGAKKLAMKSPLKFAETLRRPAWGTPNTAGVSIPRELAFANVDFHIGATSILDDVSLVAEASKLTCLLGPSGSGKTTLLRIAAGMEQQSSGLVQLDDVTVGGPDVFLPPEERGVGLVFQDYALFPHLNLLANVSFGLAHLNRKERFKQAMNMLERVGLADRTEDYPHQLSGGEQQRVALARALAPRPGVLLMDEPFSGLDSRLRDTMREQTLAVLRETRATSVVVTHDPEEALRMGDKIVLLHLGKVEQIGTGRELYGSPNSLFAAAFFSELNIFECIAGDGVTDTPLGNIESKNIEPGTNVTAAVRVGALDVSKATKSSKGLRGRVLSAQFSGDHEHLQIGVTTCEQPIYARIEAGSLNEPALAGKAEVVIKPRSEGSFVFPTV